MEKKSDKKLISDLKAGWQRTQADFDNYKRRCDADKANWTNQAKIKVFEQILPVLDNLVLASEHAPQKPNEWEIGILHIAKQIEQTIFELGIKKISPKVGENFDINYHEAVATIEDKKAAPNSIVKVQSHGYILGDKLIRAAKVVVAK